MKSAALFLIAMLVTHGVQAATLVVANKAEATASLIDLDSGQVVATLPTGDGPHEVGISPDGRHALVTNYGTRGGDGNTLTLIDIAAAEVVRTIDLGEYKRPHGVEWTDAEHAAVTVEDNQALIVVNVKTGDVVQTLDTNQDVSHMVALGPDGKRAYVANIGSGSVTVLNLVSGERERNVPTGEGAEGIAVTDGRLWVTNRGADTVSVLDTETFETLKELRAEGFPIRATATPAGQVLVTLARAGKMKIYDAAALEEVQTVGFDFQSMDVEGRLFGDQFGESSVPIGVVVDGTGKHAFVAHANADIITDVDLASGDVVRVLRAGREPDGMGFSPQTVAP